MSKPTIIMVPGAWHTPAHFSAVRSHLESVGYTVIGVFLPGNSDKLIHDRLPNMQDDIDAVRATIKTQLDAGQDVLLVTHSYSSIVGSAALTDLSTAARSASGKITSVIGLIIIAGFLCPPGATMLQLMGGSLSPQYLLSDDQRTTLPFAGPGAIHVLYNDLPHNESLKAVHKLRPQSYAINTSPIPDQIAGIGKVPVSYLACSEDNAVPFEGQKGFVKGFRHAGVEVREVRVARGGHSPFLRWPEDTAGLVGLVAGEEGVECGFEALKDEDGVKLY